MDVEPIFINSQIQKSDFSWNFFRKGDNHAYLGGEAFSSNNDCSNNLVISNPLEPSIPTQNSPINNSDTSETDIVFNCSGSIDYQGDPITYYYFGSNDSSNLVLLGTNNTGTGLSYAIDNLSFNETYYWNCLAGDGSHNSSLTDIWEFENNWMNIYAVLDVTNNTLSAGIDNVFKKSNDIYT